MTTNETAFNGERLKAARLYHGLTISEVAEKVGISKQAISQFEKRNGSSEPKLETLFKLCSVLGFPREYFFQETDGISVGDTYFRSLSTTTNRERSAQKERVKLLAAVYLGIEEFIKFPELKLLAINEELSINVETLAKEVRKYWHLGSKPIPNIIDVMEQNGIVVNSAALNSHNIDAFSQIIRIGDRPVAIVILGDDKESSFRRNFNAAHELGHLLLDDFYNVSELSKLEYHEMENTMNYFAGALLIPSETYRADLQTKSITDLNLYIRLKQKYHVSAAALIVRAKQIEAITYSQYQYLMKQLSSHGYRMQEPLDKETPLVKPRYLKEAMRMIIEEDGVQSREFLDAITDNGTTLTTDIVESVLNLPEGYLSMNDRTGDIINLKRNV